MPFQKVLVANRGEIALRILRTCRQMGYATVAVYSDADAEAPFVKAADEAIRIGPAPSRESYLSIEAILEAARESGADAVHPGYGFLAENAAFARACQEAGLVFIGPDPETIDAMGSKVAARRLMAEHGVPVIPGYQGDARDIDTLRKELSAIGLPLLIKASAGGGGKGMRVVRSLEPAILESAILAARREALSAFGDDTLLFERYIEKPRHIEIQILGDSHGNLVHLFERECSIQRRYQKIIEESPSTALDETLRARIAEAALTVGRTLRYRSAGTVEFILAPEGDFYFLEVNTRLQVEHPVTEMRTGLDLVRLQLLVAEGAPLPFTQADIQGSGHAIECRLYAEDPRNHFLPSTGTIRDWHFSLSEGERLDTGVVTNSEVSIYYDPMLAKLITHGATRAEATRKMRRALAQASILGVTTNQDFLYEVLRHPAWEKGETDTHFIETHFPESHLGASSLTESQLIEAALAATLAEVEARRETRQILPRTPLGWRNNPWRMTERIFRHGEQEVTIHYREISHRLFDVSVRNSQKTLAESIGGVGDAAKTPPRAETASTGPAPQPTDPLSKVRVVRAEYPALSLEIDGHLKHFRVVWDKDAEERRVWVRLWGASVTLDAVPRFPEIDTREEKGTCAASMPGKVLKVLVSVGEEVKEGQGLVILEAMKMEHTISAPQDGTIRSVLVEEGQQVEAGEVLVSLEE